VVLPKDLKAKLRPKDFNYIGVEVFWKDHASLALHAIELSRPVILDTVVSSTTHV
jgi:hypothetical protein